MSQAPTEQRSIKFDHFQVVDVHFRVGTYRDKTVTKNLNVKLHYNTEPVEEDDDRFSIEFGVELTNQDSNFELSLVSLGHFLTNNMIVDEDFLKSDFVKLNAPAIIFPYIRSFITTLVVNAGLNPVILPAFNFNKIREVSDTEERTDEEVQ